MVEHLYTYDNPTSQRDIQKIVKVLSHDGVIAYPTDLNWAIGCDGTSVHGLERLRLIKPSHGKYHPFSLIFNSISMAADYVHIDNASYRLLKKLWPGPYTVLLMSVRTLARQLKDKRKVIGVRIPKSPLLHAVVEALGRPLATTSFPAIMTENESNEEETIGRFYKFGYEIAEEFGHVLDMVIDLGHELPGLESTIIDLTESVPVLVRRGAGDPQLFES